jgi:hypothetical protein
LLCSDSLPPLVLARQEVEQWLMGLPGSLSRYLTHVFRTRGAFRQLLRRPSPPGSWLD